MVDRSGAVGYASSGAPVRKDLLRWQLDGYATYHRAALNLWIHLFAVPWFVASSLAFVVALIAASWGAAAGAALSALVAFVVQGIGHKREAAPPVPFDGAADAVTRILAEQFVTFPRFLFGGGWRAALRAV